VQRCYDNATSGATHISEALTFRDKPYIAYYDARKKRSRPILMNMHDRDNADLSLKFKEIK